MKTIHYHYYYQDNYHKIL